MNPLIHIINGKVITPGGILAKASVLVSGNSIVDIEKSETDVPGALVIDAGGKYISPGFIDIHVHGGGGADFMDNEVEGFLKIANTHCRYGTTSMVPTTLSAGRDSLFSMLKTYEAALEQNTNGAAFLGIHLEGPYFAMNQRGAQDPRFVRNPDPGEYMAVIAASSHIRRWSAAPELEGAIEFGRYLQEHNIIPAIAHTDAIYEEVLHAFNNGYKLITHLYSGMSGVTRRNAYRFAGTVESAFLLDDMFVEIIADGSHLPASLLQLVYRIKGPHRIALITDAMRAAGQDVSESMLGHKINGLPVIVEDGVAKLPDRTAFAGSVATSRQLVKNMIEMAGVALMDAVRMMTETPAQIMNVQSRKGALRKGFDADLVIFDENINIQMTMVEGRVVYSDTELNYTNTNQRT